MKEWHVILLCSFNLYTKKPCSVHLRGHNNERIVMQCASSLALQNYPTKPPFLGEKYNDDRRETGNLNYRPKGRSRSLINYFSCERWSEVELSVFPTAWQRMVKPTQSYIFYILRGRLGLWEPSMTELNLITYVHLL